MSSHGLKEKLESVIRNVPDFPKPGIQFKDIMPIFLNAELCNQAVDSIINVYNKNQTKIDAVCSIESRGFFLGILIANKLGVPMIPIRKKGKLPAQVKSYTYDLEYGSATVEIQTNIVKPEWNVLIHDDLLATGGTAKAAAELIKTEGGIVAGFAFIAELDFLKGRELILPYSNKIVSLVNY
ncbi:MAG: adenine phosphoribosyltransferase [Bacteroidetes bacterium]|nr:adenine phosphoribosyltransferase [Bacteroidota bacterium]